MIGYRSLKIETITTARKTDWLRGKDGLAFEPGWDCEMG